MPRVTLPRLVNPSGLTRLTFPCAFSSHLCQLLPIVPVPVSIRYRVLVPHVHVTGLSTIVLFTNHIQQVSGLSAFHGNGLARKLYR